MTEEEKKLVEDSAVKRLRALKDIDPRLGAPLSEKIIRMLKIGAMVDSGNRLIRGPHWIKTPRSIPPSFSPGYSMGDNQSTVITAVETKQIWTAKDNVNESRAYDAESVPGQEFEMADEAPHFRARALVQSRQAVSVDNVQVSHELARDGYVYYWSWFQGGPQWPERDMYGKAKTTGMELVDWFGNRPPKGFPTQACKLYLIPDNFHPGTYRYAGEPARDDHIFLIPRYRDPKKEVAMSKERERERWLDEQMKRQPLPV